MVPPPPGRFHRLCRKPAQEIPGHLPASISGPPDEADRVALWEACKEIIDFWCDPGRPHVPGGQPAHQAVCLLGMADKGRCGGQAGRGAPGRGLYQAQGHGPTGRGRLLSELYVFHLAGCPVRARRASAPTWKSWPTPAWPTICARISGPIRQISCRARCGVGPPAAFALRYVLAATLSPSYGVYSGYELCENVPASPDNEEYLNSEKYEIKHRDFARPGLAGPAVRRRQRHPPPAPGVQPLRTVHFHGSDNPNIIAYSKTSDDGSDSVLVVVTLDPYATQESTLHLDMPVLAAPTPLPGWRSTTSFRARRTRGASTRTSGWTPGAGWPTYSTSAAISEPGKGRVLWPRLGPYRVPPARMSAGTRGPFFTRSCVRGFFDSNDDGTGDIPGIMTKLDYIQWLGVDCIWLLPFYQSPLRDGGYDISDLLDGAARVRPGGRRGPTGRRGPPKGHKGDCRPGHKPHQRPTPVVCRVPPGPDQPQGRLVRVERRRPALSGSPHHFCRYGKIELGVGPSTGPVLLAPVFRSPARPQLRQPRCGRHDARRRPLLARRRPRRVPSGRRAVPVRAGGNRL